VDVSLLVMRLIVGLIMAVHGAQKLFGSFEGKGLAETVKPPPDGLGILGYPVAVGECLGGIGIMIGFLTRFSAASNIVIMLGAIAMVHGKNGLLMQKGGFEYNLALIGLLLPILLCGPGRISIGRFLPLPKSKVSDRPVIVLE
jgi:putative oxidoreductase